MMNWISSLVLLIIFNHARCSVIFELRLKSFINDFGKDSLGQCCSGEQASVCSAPCRTKFRICLKHYQATVDKDPPCTFGEVITPVLGENTVDFGVVKDEAFNNPIRFNFDFSWPGTFSLVVEAWNENNSSSRSGGSDTPIFRLLTQRWLAVGEDWHEQVEEAAHSVLTYEYRVMCAEHYYGVGCENLCRPRNDNFGHYTCSMNGNRVCMEGWQGDYCSKARCLPGCDEQHGHCNKPNECLCHSGWKGRLCHECERYPGCLHGTCQKPWECLCDEGWGGLFCNQDLNYCTNHKPCRHGGTCFNTGQGSYTCSCPPGFTGTDCETEIDDCAHQPCLNGGSCRDNGTSYICDCPKNWHGTHCETSAQTCQDQPCQNGATCDDSSSYGYKCLCLPGYNGVNCEQEIDECDVMPCKNGATCVDKVNGYECHCPQGFRGSNCEVNIDDCGGNPCLNGGTCVDLVNQFRCQCVPGYVGPLCQSKVDYCLAKPCANGGKCVNLVNDYRCTCKAGFTGKDCSVDIDECASSPCLNGGRCVNRVNGYRCECQNSWKGRHCQDEETVSVGNISRHVYPQADSGLTTEHVVVIATLSTAVPILVLVAAVIVICMKQRRKREQQRADDEARMQNEQNAVHSSVAKRGDTHMIKNTWGPCPKEGGDLCFTKQCAPVDNTPVYTLHRSRSHKQLNTDAPVHRQSNRDLENLSRTDKRISVLSVDSSLCNASDSSLLKRPHEKDSGGSSSVYVIDEHFPQHTLLATEV